MMIEAEWSKVGQGRLALSRLYEMGVGREESLSRMAVTAFRRRCRRTVQKSRNGVSQVGGSSAMGETAVLTGRCFGGRSS